MAETTKFMCKVMTSAGSISEIILEGEDASVVERTIRRKGDTPISIKENVSEGSTDLGSVVIFEKKVKSKDLSLFCKQMHTMLYAGMPLIKALGVMGEQVEHSTLKKVCLDMMAEVQKGRMFSQAMKKHKKYFPPLLIAMVESGEMTGRQDEVLEKMAIHYEKEDKVEKKIKNAMVYPKFLSVLTIVVVVIMLTQILPIFTKIFKDNGTELPWITEFVMGLSDALVQYWYVFLGVLIIMVVGFKTFVNSTGGKRAWDRFLLKMPLVKISIAKIATSRFTRTLSTLLTSGVPLLMSLQMAGKVTGNTVVQDGIEDITEDIKKGRKLSALIKQITVFPSMLVSMIAIGEESGALDDMLERTSDFYDSELEASLTKMVGLIEPAMIVVMAIIIGFIIVAMVLPMITLFRAYQG